MRWLNDYGSTYWGDLITKNPANYSYFFGQLKDPEWLSPASRCWKVQHPPSAVREPNTIAFPAWPEGGYLVRMADLRPELVSEGRVPFRFQ